MWPVIETFQVCPWYNRQNLLKGKIVIFLYIFLDGNFWQFSSFGVVPAAWRDPLKKYESSYVAVNKFLVLFHLCVFSLRADFDRWPNRPLEASSLLIGID